MDTTTAIVLNQVLIILILVLVGAVCHKAGLISEKAADNMAGFALKIVTPCVVIKAFQIDFDARTLYNMLIAGALAVLSHVVGIILAQIFFRKKTDENGVLKFATVYSNCGFMGIPLIEGVVGSEGVLYTSVFLVVFQALIWSHGIVTLKGSLKSIKLHKIFINAGTIGLAIGLVFFFMSIRLPAPLASALSHVANLNTPLAMIISGVYIARTNILKAFVSLKGYLCVILRHFVVPLAVLAFLLAFKVDKTISLTMLLLSACPVASSVTLFASLYSSKSALDSASRILTLSNICSVFTVPLVTMIYSYVS